MQKQQHTRLKKDKEGGRSHTVGRRVRALVCPVCSSGLHFTCCIKRTRPYADLNTRACPVGRTSGMALRVTKNSSTAARAPGHDGNP
jgi:hypothetical protein